MGDTSPLPQPERPELVSISEAARRLGRSRQAVQRRIARGTLETERVREGNRETLRVRWPLPSPPPQRAPAPAPSPHPEPGAGAKAELVAELRERMGRLEERLAAAEEAKTELRRELAEVKAERNRLLAMLDDALAERRPAERRPWPGLRQWWRRVWEGEE